MKKLLPLSILSTITLMAVSCGGTPSTSTPESSSEEPQVSLPACQEDNKVHVVILTGQSGARGKARNVELTNEQKMPNYEVDIFADGLTMPQLANIPSSLSPAAEITELTPKFGDSASEFGPEMGIGETYASRYLKDGEDRKSVIIKYTACGSTFTDHWYSSSAVEDENISSKLNKDQIRTNTVTGKEVGPLTNNLYQAIDATLDQLDSEGYEAVIDGAIFVHGEQDAKYDVNMDIYEDALKYFMNDLRAYVNDEDLPFVITEALTNSAKYSNKLRDIQTRVVNEDSNAVLVPTADLYTNRFEPWHFGAESNYILGNRAASEIIKFNDNREIEEVLTDSVNVPLGAEVKLPEYINATYTSEYTGTSKIKYTSSYDKNTLGEQEVKYVVDSRCGTPYEGTMKVNVTNDPYIDGVMNEYSSKKENAFGDLGKLYVHKGENGLFVSGTINDKDLWTDGEYWDGGDYGQSGRNDDLRMFLTTGDAEDRYTICLSAANLLRLYDTGANDLSSATINRSNLYSSKTVIDVKYHVTTRGLANVPEGNQSNGFDFEFYVGYEDLGIDNPDDIKLCFTYNNISNPENVEQGGVRPSTNVYLAKNNVDNPEEDINNYYSISELI